MSFAPGPGGEMSSQVRVAALDRDHFPGGQGASHQEVSALIETEILKVDSQQR
jgi:hypothetical protein